MIVNLQFDEAANFIWGLFQAIPEDQRAQFSRRVDHFTTCLCHPPSSHGVTLRLQGVPADERPGVLCGTVVLGEVAKVPGNMPVLSH